MSILLADGKVSAAMPESIEENALAPINQLVRLETTSAEAPRSSRRYLASASLDKPNPILARKTLPITTASSDTGHPGATVRGQHCCPAAATTLYCQRNPST
ncbi:hypothetical protein Hbut_1402 [Hyperthermus butylicus DSM 5456]|uniref:Uncharacterized protein n=1 Tax=Hyperthermus butylicus (strain DSM 5456 / JCM 9403 / PLM1-5) TaxID=415426 RepID=A2BML4_HYPBU|nr:hypothetical protein Hbut_1402 [Hyperthermus butylicus DSM 5456]